MAYKIAVATSDGVNVDLHFGSTETFTIFTVENRDYEITENRTVPKWEVTDVNQSNCYTGCNSGCGSGHGCHGGGGNSLAVELLKDCRAIVCAKIGRNILKQFETRAISTFDIEMPVSEALPKIIEYYYKIDLRRLKTEL